MFSENFRSSYHGIGLPWQAMCGLGSREEYPKGAVTEDKVNYLRGALPPGSPLSKQKRALIGLHHYENPETIQYIATQYGEKLFYRHVYQSFKRLQNGEDLLGQHVPYKLVSGHTIIWGSISPRHLLPRAYYIAAQIHEAFRKNSLKAATEMICSLTPSDVPQILKVYLSLFEVPLERDIEIFTAGNHRKLLLNWMRRVYVGMLTPGHLEEILRSVHKHLKETFNYPQKTIMKIILGLREEHLRVIADRYLEEYGTSLEMNLTLAQYGHFGHGLLTIIKCAVNRPKYFAEILNGAMRDPNGQAMRDLSDMDRKTIVRVITTVPETDMMMINEEYRQISGSTLEKDVFHAFSDRQDCLQLIIWALGQGGISNGNNGHGSTGDPRAAAIEDVFIRLHGAFDREQSAVSPHHLELLFQGRESLHHIASQYDHDHLFYRAVYESCKRVYGDDKPPFRDALLRWLLPRDYFIAIQIYEAFRKNFLKVATEIICCLIPSEIPQIQESYFSLFGKEIEDDIENFTAGSHRKLLLEYVRLASALHGDTDVEMLGQEHREEILKSLRKGVIETFKCPQKAIMEIFLGLTEDQLRVVADRYLMIHGRSLEKDLTLAKYGHFEHGLVTMMKCAVNRSQYFAEELDKAMRDPNIQGMRERDHIDLETIMRVITTAADGDMIMIKEAYREKFRSRLEDDVSHAFLDHRECLQLIRLLLNPSSPN